MGYQKMQNNLKDLRDRIKRKIPYLTNNQKVIANYIIENPEKFALSSIRDIEKELNISKSSITRLGQALGYDGFSNLKSVFLKDIRRELDPIKRYKTYLFESSKKASYLKLISEETVNNIHTTLKLVDIDQFKKAVDLIEEASHVYTVGLGISTYIAEIASYLLNRVSINSSFMMHGGLTFPEQIINLPKNDVILSFSFPPYSEETIQAVHYAQEKNIKVISVSDKVTNEICRYSDVSLQVNVESITVSNSIMSILVLLYSICAQIGNDLREKTLETIESIQHVRKDHLGESI